MNHLVFNTVASELKTTIFALAPGDQIRPLQMDATDNLLVSVASGTVTVSAITASVTIANETLTVSGTVTVSGIEASVTIANETLTVSGTVTVGGTVTVSGIEASVTIANDTLTVSGTVTVGGTVTVSGIEASVTIANDTLTVSGTVTVGGTVTVSGIEASVTIANDTLTVGGSVTVFANRFDSDEVVSEVITGTGVLFADTDISPFKVASIFVYNEGDVPITLSLQVSPTTDDARYMDDPSYTDQVIGEDGSLYIAVNRFAHYIRLQYNMDTETGTVSAYYNAQA